jgi:hypothetical protein
LAACVRFETCENSSCHGTTGSGRRSRTRSRVGPTRRTKRARGSTTVAWTSGSPRPLLVVRPSVSAADARDAVRTVLLPKAGDQ